MPCSHSRIWIHGCRVGLNDVGFETQDEITVLILVLVFYFGAGDDPTISKYSFYLIISFSSTCN